MAYTYDENIVSDLHKDARGYRPREMWWSEWNNGSDDDRQYIWDNLCRELEEEIRREQFLQEEAARAFEKRILDTQVMGAIDEDTAIRWILQSMDLDEYDIQYGADYILWEFGLSYSHPRRDQIDRIMISL